jgi:hypothetical protein
MLTTKTLNPQTTFSMDYYKMLMRSSKAKAEEYRQTVTAPRPNAIDVGLTRGDRDPSVALLKDAVIKNDQIQNKMEWNGWAWSDGDKSPIIDADNISTDTLSDNPTGDVANTAQIAPQDVITSINIADEVNQARADEIAQSKAPELPADAIPSITDTKVINDEITQAPTVTPPADAEVIDIKTIKKKLLDNGIKNANFLSEEQAIEKAKELNLL